MVNTRAKALVQRESQEAGSLPRACVETNTRISVEIGLVQLAMRDTTVAGYTWDLYV